MMIHTTCPIDGTDNHDVEVYPATFDLSRVSTETYSARRVPDRMYYRMVRNTRTGCLRADPILDDETVLALYRGAKLNCQEVSEYATETYLRYLQKALKLLPDKRGMLEIGCGQGPFLERSLKMGFGVVKGVEPSSDAVARATGTVRPHIVQAGFGPGLFAADEFSLICGFQVLDHLPRPNEVLQECRKILVADGVMYWICHDVGSIWARVLGTRSPMLDIQHVVLYDRKTITHLFQKNGFEVIDVFGVWNRYPLSYWWHLTPAPEGIKAMVRRLLDAARVGGVTLCANFGNLGIIARKSPAQARPKGGKP
jgi:SAM-dependent methyltransferase